MATNCSSPSTDNTVLKAALIVSHTSSAISVLTNCLVVFFIILLKRWSFLNQRLVLYLSLATLIGLIADLLSKFSKGRFCIFTAFATQHGSWITLSAYLCITISLLIRVFSSVNLEKLDWVIVPAIFVSPLLWNWIPFIHHTYGQSGFLCWIKQVEEINGTCQINDFGRILQLVLWYLPLYLILSVLIIFYVIVLIKFCFHKRHWMTTDLDSHNERRNALKYTTSLLAYPMVYFMTNIFPFVDRLYSQFDSDKSSSVLLFLNTLSYPQQGAWIAIVFFVSVRRKLTLAHLKAALGEWRHATKVVEYDFISDELETSIQGPSAKLIAS